MSRKHAFLPFLVLLSVAFNPNAAQSASPDEGAKGSQWRYYGGDAASTKYSPLDQINRENVGKVKVVWAWDSPDLALQKENRALSSFAHEITPLMVGGTLYTSTSLSQVAAINAQTGEQIWVFDPEAYKAGRPTNLGFVHRGIAYWTDGRQERVYLASHDAQLWAIDAKTGKAVSEFGDDGRVNLAKAIPRAINSRNYTMTSPPVICRDVVIVGSSISDGPQNKEGPRGAVQAFDVRTGKPAWIFHVIPQEGEFGNDTWATDTWRDRGGLTAWGGFSLDVKRGMLFAGIGNPERFFEHLRSLGIDAFCRAFPYHHRFTPADLALPDASAILMTEKDAVKCVAFADDRCWALPVRAVIEDSLVTLIEERLRGFQTA